MDEASNPFKPAALSRPDVLHDQQLLRDLALVNARTTQELGPLPAGGIPAAAKRKPNLPCPAAPTLVPTSYEHEETGMNLQQITATAALMTLTACSSPPTTAASPRQETSPMTTPTQADPAKRAKMNFAAVEWPLRFKTHSFSVFTYDIYGCKVLYAGQLQKQEDENEPQRSSASYGPDYQKNWSGTHGMIPNFPPPAKVTWRSKDGAAHEAEIDIGQLFADELILHKVPREEMSEAPGNQNIEPSILLEVNDRAIRVYMRAMIFTKELQIPGNRYSNFRDDLILVKTYTY